MRQPRRRASDNEWAILGACSVLYNCSGGLVFCLHIITCYNLFPFSNCSLLPPRPP